MSLSIQTNIQAITAHRNLVMTQNGLSTAMERLSSGFRINRAADDAAGLAISEKLEAQVGGLDQAQRNAQDAVSLVQTAEGAMAEVQSMLQRVRDLAVQFNNGTLSAQDKAAITAEVAQLCAEISDIGTQTQFNGINLLTGSSTITFQVGVERRPDDRGQRGAALRQRRELRGRLRPVQLLRDGRPGVDRRGDPERVATSEHVRIGAEPARPPAEQPGDLRGEPAGVGELDQGRRHGVGDDEVHPAPDLAAGRHGDARPGERSAAVRTQAAPASTTRNTTYLALRGGLRGTTTGPLARAARSHSNA